MKESRAAVRYAKAALEFAIEKKAADQVDADMRHVLEVLEESEEFRNMLGNPVLEAAVKKQYLMEIFAKSHQISRDLIALLVDNKRIGQLSTVAAKYVELNELLKGEKVAYVTTAVPLSKELEKKILAQVESFTKNKVTLENIVDEQIIGGFVLRVGDMQFNSSIANKLNNIKREITNS